MAAADSRAAILLSLLLWRGACAGEAAQEFNLTEVAPGVFAHFGATLSLDAPGHDDIANLGFVVGEKCVAVIDSGGSVRIGALLRGAVARHTALPICYVINTHVHVDHVLGNAAFRPDRPSFVGHAALPEAIARSREFFLREYAADLTAPASGDQIIAPDRTVNGVLDLDLGGRTLSLRAWPTAHTDCDLTAFDRKTRTLWSGDLVFLRRLPALDGSLRGWLSVLDELSHIDARSVVPGHGPVADGIESAIRPERRYLAALSADVRAAIAHGDSMQGAVGRVAIAERPRWQLWDTVHPRNVLRAYQELEWE